MILEKKSKKLVAENIIKQNYSNIDSNTNQKELLNSINETINQIGFEVGSLCETSDYNLIDLKLNKIQTYINSNQYLALLKTDFNNLNQISK